MPITMLEKLMFLIADATSDKKALDASRILARQACIHNPCVRHTSHQRHCEMGQKLAEAHLGQLLCAACKTAPLR